ncbi:hypothetical protein [Endozoicomonas sp. YOMI1]|uniref:hypothetical protein n=1 Tax=Endozoicomonas sp. YOMI1 TaxID=2828739 RepID=UPI0021496877|nr:hypothetical protein [Endozoicomonas sp. YOMI1]
MVFFTGDHICLELGVMLFVAVASLPASFPDRLLELIWVWTELLRVTALVNTDEKKPLCCLVSALGLSVLGSKTERVRDILPLKLTVFNVEDLRKGGACSSSMLVVSESIAEPEHCCGVNNLAVALVSINLLIQGYIGCNM